MLLAFSPAQGRASVPLGWKHRELENKGRVNDIYRDLILERAHFIMTLCQKCGFIRRQEARDTGDQYLGSDILTGKRIITQLRFSRHKAWNTAPCFHTNPVFGRLWVKKPLREAEIRAQSFRQMCLQRFRMKTGRKAEKKINLWKST